MTPPVLLAHQILGLLDAVAAFVMLWAAQRITTAAGFCSAQALWALWRRVIYLSMAVALFGLGVKRFFSDIDDVWSAIFQGVILIGIISFPLLRAMGIITQDMLIDGIRSDRYGRTAR